MILWFIENQGDLLLLRKLFQKPINVITWHLQCKSMKSYTYGSAAKMTMITEANCEKSHLFIQECLFISKSYFSSATNLISSMY